MTQGKSPFHCGSGEAYDRPAVMPPHPAIVAEERFEAAFVADRRARRVSWQNIARMLEVCEIDLRHRYGPVGQDGR